MPFFDESLESEQAREGERERGGGETERDMNSDRQMVEAEREEREK